MQNLVLIAHDENCRGFQPDRVLYKVRAFILPCWPASRSLPHHTHMNASLLRVMIVIALGAVDLSGRMTPAHAGAETVKAPPCSMACCVQGECECKAVPEDAPQMPAPNAPVAGKQAMTYVPTLLAILPAPAAGGIQSPVLPAAIAGRWHALATPIFRLHCAMLT